MAFFREGEGESEGVGEERRTLSEEEEEDLRFNFGESRDAFPEDEIELKVPSLSVLCDRRPLSSS